VSVVIADGASHEFMVYHELFGGLSVSGIAASCEESQTGVTALVEKKLGALQKP
jgi:hypothetical protein